MPDDGAGTEPVYANGLVYVAGYFSMNAYNAATGAAVWHVSLNGLVRSVPAVSNGRLFLATECCAEPRPRANFLVLDASTGTVLWSKRVGSDLGFQQASPVVHVDMVYQCSGSTLYALLVKTGRLRWSEPYGCDDDSTPGLAGGLLYAANQYTDQVYAINAATGAVVWSAPGTGSDNAAPAVATVWLTSLCGQAQLRPMTPRPVLCCGPRLTSAQVTPSLP